MSTNKQQPAPTGTTNPATLPPSLQLLLQKQQEYAALQALKEASGDLVGRVEKLSEMTNVMADGGEAVAKVLQNWAYVFSILGSLDMTREGEAVPQMIRLPHPDAEGAAESGEEGGKE